MTGKSFVSIGEVKGLVFQKPEEDVCRLRPADGEVVGLPVLDLDVIEDPPLTLSKMRDLFRRTTGLDLFLFFLDPSTSQWQERPLVDTIHFPRFCQLVRSRPGGLERCYTCHQEMVTRVNQSSSGLSYRRCHANLVALHYPIALPGKGLASIQTVCTLVQNQKAQDIFRVYEQIADLGLPVEDVFEAIDDLRVLSESELHGISAWFGMLADYLAELSRCRCSVPGGAERVPQLSASTPLEERIRFEVGKCVVLPSAGKSKSCCISPALIESVAVFIKEFYYLPLSTQVVASALGFEPSFFAKMFKRHMDGASMTSHLRSFRLARAKKLLKNPYLSVQEVADRTGFSDPSYFTRVFRRMTGITPTEFKKDSEVGALATIVSSEDPFSLSALQRPLT